MVFIICDNDGNNQSIQYMKVVVQMVEGVNMSYNCYSDIKIFN